MVGYQVADANEYLVVTGLGIDDFELKKKRMVWPLQRCTRFTVTPLNYEVEIKALSNEKLSLRIPASLTIGPNIDEPEELHKYVTLLVSDGSEEHQERLIRERITGIVEGEMRAVAASMAIEEIFNNRKHFLAKVTEYIQEALNKFGLVLYNANVREINDSAGYFQTIGQRAQEGAASLAKVAVAEARANGDIGAQERESRSQKEISRLKAETLVFENERAQSIAQSKAELAVKEANFTANVQIAQIEGQKSAQMREAELQKEVEKRRAAVETERLRADEYAKAVVEGEKIKQLADAHAYEKQKQAEANYYETQKQAEGKLYSKEKEAEAIQKIYSAQAEGLTQLIKSFGSPDYALQYLMLEKGLYQQLAAENAKAIQGLQPKFNIWTTGDGNAGDASKPLRNVFQTLPPLLTTIQEQTGIQPPSWLAQMPTANPPSNGTS